MDVPRSLERRKADTLRLLDSDEDVWVATTDENGEPRLTPLSFAWFQGHVVLATPQDSPTGRNLARGGLIRLAFGATRDVVLMDGHATYHPAGSVPEDIGNVFATKVWDAREESQPFGFYQVKPDRIQAWREVNEIQGRTLMRQGEWLMDSATI